MPSSIEEMEKSRHKESFHVRAIEEETEVLEIDLIAIRQDR